MVFAERLKALRKEKGLTQDEFSKLSGIGRSAVSMYEAGKRAPSYEVLSRLAQFFAVSTDYLLGNTDSVDPAGSQNDGMTHYTFKVPVVSRVAAGQPILAQQEIIDYEYIDERLRKGDAEYFCLVVKGASMEPTIHDGDTIVVRVQEQVENGQIAVVLVDGEDATVKEIKESNDGITLIGHNVGVYAPHFYSAQEVQQLPVKIIGRVVQSISKF